MDEQRIQYLIDQAIATERIAIGEMMLEHGLTGLGEELIQSGHEYLNR